MAGDMGRLLAKSTIRIILKNYSKFTTEICSHSRFERDHWSLTSDMTSCINNLTIVPEKSVDLPAALNSGKNNG